MSALTALRAWPLRVQLRLLRGEIADVQNELGCAVGAPASVAGLASFLADLRLEEAALQRRLRAIEAGDLCIADVLESAMTPAAVVIAAIACAAVAIFTA